MFEYKHLPEEIKYNGDQLKPHWIFKNFGIQGNAMVSFIGPCQVESEDLVDLFDAKKKAVIYSPRMLHFIAEFFNPNLELMVIRQRLFVFLLKEELDERGIAGRIVRQGDDLFHVGIAGVKRKLTVSIATRSITSSVMHTGINVHVQGTPVPTAGLDELGIDPENFALSLMENFKNELTGLEKARCKVKGVS